MTLIINEIHLLNGLSETFQIAAADRRITRAGKIEAPRKKLFVIPHLKATVSYFGLAGFTKNNQNIYFSEVIKYLIDKSTHTNNLREFSFYLRDRLNNEVPYKERKNNISGFHISGYTKDGLPDFWHFSNISGMDGTHYLKPVEKYGDPTSDFLERDAKHDFGWDGQNPLSARNGGKVYRNGDIGTHIITSDLMDQFMSKIIKLDNFNDIKNIKQYADYVKFKFEIISYIYSKWAKTKLISRPIDVVILTKEGLMINKNDKWEFYK